MIVLSSLAILGIGIVVTLAMIFIVRKFVPAHLHGEEEKRGWIFAFCGVIYALVVGFVLAFALQGYRAAEADTTMEADSVTALSRSASLFDRFSRERIDHELICYSRAVIDDEWPAMEKGDSSPKATFFSDQLYATFGALGETGENDVALSGSLDRVRELDEARASRLIKSTQHLPAIFWIFMIFGGLMLIGYATVLAGRESTKGQMLYILPVTLLLICSIYLVALFEQPFSGNNKLEPTAMESSLASITRFVPDHRAIRVCD